MTDGESSGQLDRSRSPIVRRLMHSRPKAKSMPRSASSNYVAALNLVPSVPVSRSISQAQASADPAQAAANSIGARQPRPLPRPISVDLSTVPSACTLVFIGWYVGRLI